MSTQTPTARQARLDELPRPETDTAAILEAIASGTRPAPAIVERVHARAELVTESIRRAHGLVDDDTFQSLLDDEA